MVHGNYGNIIEKISKASGVEKGEIERRIEAKIAKLSGLVSKEGAAQIIAAELGISFDNEKLKISELLPGMKKVNMVGKIIKSSPVREFNKNGRTGKVSNLLIADETSNIKVVLWDTNHIELIEKNKIKEGDVIEILNANMRDTELHLGSFSELKLSSEKIGDVKTEIVLKEKNIAEFKINENIRTRAFIVQAFEPRFFEICPECRGKISKDGASSICGTHGKILPEKRVLLNIVLDDGTDNIRAVLFNEQISKLGLVKEDIENTSLFINKREELIGKEMFFSGNIRQNKLFNNPEFFIDNIQEINLDELILQLEKT